MKKTIIIALAIVAALSMVSCKNNNKKSQEPTQEEIQAQKQALADSVLAQIDDFANKYIEYSNDNRFRFSNIELTDAEKMVKPDYLLDPATANQLVTKSQKVNALAIYLIELAVRKSYDMPLDEAKEAIGKLAADVNHPVDYDNVPKSEQVKCLYEECRKSGDIAYFWQFQNAIIYEVLYLQAQNPEIFFSRITDQQWVCDVERRTMRRKAINTLAQYDEEMATVSDFLKQNALFSTWEEYQKANATKESAKQFRIDNKDKYIAIRNALLQ